MILLQIFTFMVFILVDSFLWTYLSTLQLATPTVVVVEYSDDAPDLLEMFSSVRVHIVDIPIFLSCAFPLAVLK